jgi:hypothetical protein
LPKRVWRRGRDLAPADGLATSPGALVDDFVTPRWRALVDGFVTPRWRALVDDFVTPRWRALVDGFVTPRGGARR